MSDKIVNFFKARNRRRDPWLTFIAVLALAFISYGVAGLFHNGTKGIFVCDMYGQYYSFFQALHRMVWSGESFSYSWDLGMGMGLSSWLSYYLMSPFNIIIVLLPESLLQPGIVFMIILKISVAGGVFTWFLKKFLKNDGFETVYFGICYAFCGFATVYYSVPMWLDALILLPIVAWQARRLLLDGRVAGFTLSLAVLFVDNYYMAYMIGIFVFITFLFSYFYYRNAEKTPIEGIARENVQGNAHPLKWTVFVKFFACVFLAVGMSFAVIFPTVLQMMSRLGGDTEFWRLIQFQKNPITFYNSLFIDSYSTVEDGNPVIYSGILALMVLPMYFCQKTASKREKRYVGAGLLLFVLIMFLPVADVLMHVGSVPTWFCYRYSYLFSFLLLIIACRQLPECLEETAFRKIPENNPKGVKRALTAAQKKILIISALNVAFLILGMAFVLILKLTGHEKAGNVSGIHYIFDMNWWKLILNAGMIGAVAAAFIKIKEGSDRKLMLALLLVFEVVLNVYFTAENLGKELFYKMPYDVEVYETTLEGQLAELKETAEDNDFYRIIKNYHSTYNDGIQEGYRGIESFSSVYSPGVTRVLSATGWWTNWWEYHDWGSTEFLKSILNVKYIFHDKLRGFYVISSEDSQPYIEENEFYLPVGFMVSDDILNLEYEGNIEKNDAMVNQQRLLNAMTGSRQFQDIYKRIQPIKCEIKNAEKIEPPEGKADTENEPQKIIYRRIDMDKPASIYYECSAEENQAVYYYFTYKKTKLNNMPLEVSVSDGNGVDSMSVIPMHTQIPYNICLTQGKTVKDNEENKVKRPAGEENNSSGEATCFLRIDFANEAEYAVIDEYFYTFDLKRYRDAYNELKKSPFNLISVKTGELEGEVQAGENQVLFTSIPYEKGWSVYVDGEEKEIQPLINEAFLGVDVEKGKHNIKFVYETPGRKIGICVSLISTFVFVMLLFCFRKKNTSSSQYE